MIRKIIIIVVLQLSKTIHMKMINNQRNVNECTRCTVYTYPIDRVVTRTYTISNVDTGDRK